MRAIELTPVTTHKFIALTTFLTRVLGVYRFDPYSLFLGFVRDELLQFVERPRVDAVPLATVTDVFEVFEFDDGILELTGVFDKTF